MKKKLTAIILPLILLIAFFSYYWYAEISIEDSNLREALKQNIGKLNRANLYDVATLDLSNCNIKNLDGVQNLKNINHLCLSNNQIKEIKYINNLNIDSLDLSNNKIDNIPKLNLPKLRILDLSGNNISDIQNISNIITLEDLVLSDNNIYNICELTNLPNLTLLDLNLNDLSSIDGIENLKTLKSLFIGGNDIHYINSISNLSNLEELILSENQNIKDPIPIEYLKKLKNLEMKYTNIENIIQ
ncbi:leucine-rich repeat domain-containing protein [Vallitalea guaymasensis]|uniref:Leucine-rich repeat domain-containing protein n=1 Tax=Vallitalea guaymasensis TaxID=1185412 RepID=A0A8J8M9G2_9FIRM|nr:leucine-rich repeat domain-containing protein [Vallitalea guaymasensis]QUH28788.1 leucine-rich repeat domain-containing protein [Vallitalea guaymasensis]